MLTLNTAVAQQLTKFKELVDAAIAGGQSKRDAILQTIYEYAIASKKIRFDGNNYSAEWQKEAAERGLQNVHTAPEAWKALVTDKAHHLFVDSGIYTDRELEARYEVSLEGYIKKIDIEAKVLVDLALNYIVPAAIKYENILIENAKGLTALVDAAAAAPALSLLKEINGHVAGVQNGAKALVTAYEAAEGLGDTVATAEAYSTKVRAIFEEIRAHADELELLVDNDLWPLAKYRELLFIR